MSTYNTGTVTVTNGSAVVTGSGTAWAVALVAGGMFSSAGLAVPIASVDSNTQITLDYPWPGTTASGAAYSIALENAAAADVVSLQTTLSRVLVTLSLAGIHPDASGTIAERNALSLAMADKGYLFLHAEIGVAFAFYRWNGTAWEGPFAVANAVATGGVSSLVAGDGVTVDNTNPAIPVVSIANDAVTNAKLANVATATIKGRATASTGDPEDLTITQAIDLITGTPAAGDILYRGASAWQRLAKGTALQMLRQNTALTAPEWATAREVLTANRTYYVRTTGSDSNTGLSSGAAFLTVQKAVNVALSLDMSIYAVTIDIGAGTFAEGSFLSIQGNGNARITLQGASYTTTTISGSTYGVLATGSLSLTILNLNITGSAVGLWARYGAQVFLAGNMAFGAASARLIGCDNSAYIECVGSGNNIYLAGNSTYAIFVGSLGHVLVGSSAKMLTTAARTFTATVSATNGGVLEMQGATFDVTAGAITGSRYAAANDGVINTGGGGASFIPGSTAGTGTNPGVTPYGLYV